MSYRAPVQDMLFDMQYLAQLDALALRIGENRIVGV